MDWIAVSLKNDVPPGVVVPSRIDNTDLAIWCTDSGTYHAWSDRCPHRGMRLSHGFVRGDALACIYHGWQYNETGSCKYIPAHPQLSPPETICVPTYACTESGGVIWVALAKPAEAPPDLSGREAIRSMPVGMSAAHIAASFGATGDTVLTIGSDFDVVLALQPCAEDYCVMHALAAPGHDRKHVSRWLEEMRSTLEDTAI